MKRVLTGILLLCGLLTSPLAGAANPTSEHLQWGRWSFDYEVRDNTGLALRNVTYDGGSSSAKPACRSCASNM